MSESPSRGGRDVVVVAVLALLSLLFHGYVVARVLPAGEQFTKYPAAAERLLSGRMAAERVFDFSPLYLGIHVAARQLFADPAPAVQGLQLLLVTATGALLFFLMRRFVPLGVAAAGMLAFALSPSVIVHAHVFEPEACVLFLLTGLCLLLAKPSPPRLLAAGALFGLLLLARQNYLPLFLAPLLALGRGVGWRRRLVGSAVFALPALAALFVLWSRSAPVQGGLPAVVMNPGQVFFEGNNPLANGQSAVYPPLVEELQAEFSDEPDYAHEVYRVLARRTRGAALTVREVNRFWAGKAGNYLVDHPLRYLRQVAVKAGLAFHGHLQHDLLVSWLDARRLRERGVPGFPFALLSSLALVGLLLGASAWRSHLVLYLAFAGQFAAMLFFYVSERQRVGLVPLFVFFAGLAVAWALRSRRAAVAVTLAALAGTALLSRPLVMVQERSRAWEAYDATTLALERAVALRAQDDLGAASRENARALAESPLALDRIRLAGLWFGERGFVRSALAALPRETPPEPASRFDRALLLLESGDPDGAESLLLALERQGHRILRGSDTSSTVGFQLARCALRRGDRAGAVRRLEGALAVAPGDPYLLAHLLALTGEERYGEQLFRYYDDIDGAFLLGRAHLEAGNLEQAGRAFEYLAQVLPECSRARVYLAAALGLQGKDEAAAEVFLGTIARSRDPVLLEDEIVELFLRRMRSDPADARKAEEAARVLARYGRFAQAAAIHRGLLARGPRPDLERELTRVEAALRRYSGP